MRVYTLPYNHDTYSSNVYLLRGDFNALTDVNTVIDTGGDCALIAEIKKVNTGLGKKPVDQVILTHNHFDHTGGIKCLIKEFDPKIYSFTPPNEKYIRVRNFEHIKVADTICEVIHAPFHSADSICLYFEKEKIIFTGDVQLIYTSKGASLTPEYFEFIETLARMNLKIVYPGHGKPIVGDIKNKLLTSLSM